MTVDAPTLSQLDLVKPFVSSAQEVFQTMLGCHASPSPVKAVQDGHQMYSVTSVIGLSGRLQGAISISVTEEVSFAILNRMTGMDATEVDDFVRDAVGELANMIGGRGKRELAAFELKLGLPQVIVGASYRVYSPRWAQHHWLALDNELGPCHLDVGFNITRD